MQETYSLKSTSFREQGENEFLSQVSACRCKKYNLKQLKTYPFTKEQRTILLLLNSKTTNS